MGKNILITGYPGFLGNYIKKYFLDIGCSVYTLGLVESNDPNHIVCNLTETISELPDIEFDIVIHAAGKAHVVPKTEAEKKMFYKVNLEGTENLIKALDNLSNPPEAFIFISTVAVYGLETGRLLDENTPLVSTTPYGDSKKRAEYLINDWKSTTRKIIIRLPLLVGKNPPGNLGKMINAIRKGYYFNINGGIARRSMVLADDVVEFMQTLAEHEGIYNLTDGYHPSFREISTELATAVKGRRSKVLNIPYVFFKIFAVTGDILEKIIKKTLPVNSAVLLKMTSDLTFSDEKARTELGWKPRQVLAELPTIIK